MPHCEGGNPDAFFGGVSALRTLEVGLQARFAVVSVARLAVHRALDHVPAEVLLLFDAADEHLNALEELFDGLLSVFFDPPRDNYQLPQEFVFSFNPSWSSLRAQTLFL